MSKKILITGASSGFGKAMAYRFANDGWDLVITGRRADRLKEMADDLKKTYKVNVSVKVFDVQNRDEVFQPFRGILT